VYRAEQIPQHMAFVHSLIALTDHQIWRVDGDQQEISGTPIKMERISAARYVGLTINERCIFTDQTIFETLIEQWHRERGVTSSITVMAMCPAYQRIIAMGPKVIPLILRRMEQQGDEPDMWFWALRVLTNENPVPADAQGDVARMAQAWLDWGRLHYVW
jgi:hypothetical protein